VSVTGRPPVQPHARAAAGLAQLRATTCRSPLPAPRSPLPALRPAGASGGARAAPANGGLVARRSRPRTMVSCYGYPQQIATERIGSGATAVRVRSRLLRPARRLRSNTYAARPGLRRWPACACCPACAFFSIITRQAIQRGSFDSVAELVPAIRGFIDGRFGGRSPVRIDGSLPYSRSRACVPQATTSVGSTFECFLKPDRPNVA
jgi:hypothetical protein